MFHIDRYFFHSFHHVTRWKLIVISKLVGEKKIDIILQKYIPFKEDCGIVTEKITIENDSEKKYPTKHLNNMVEFVSS